MPATNSTKTQGVIRIGSGGGCEFFAYDSISSNSNVFIGTNMPSIANIGTKIDMVTIGNGAMQGTNAGGDGSVAIGYEAMRYATGLECVAIGKGALSVDGDSNVAIGSSTLNGGSARSFCTAVGSVAEGGGDYSVALGYAAGVNTPLTSDYCIMIGTVGGGSDPSGTIRLGGIDFNGVNNNNGPTYISGIRGVTTINNNAIGVLIDSAGQLGTVSSSIRYKENVQTLGADSDVLQRLRPVSFTYKNRPADRKEYGFIAEEVAEHIPDIVVYDADGQPETIQYHKLYGLMVSEIQRNHQKIKALEQRLADLEGKISIRLNLL